MIWPLENPCHCLYTVDAARAAYKTHLGTRALFLFFFFMIPYDCIVLANGVVIGGKRKGAHPLEYQENC